jgi:hypothetical protein
MTLVFMLSAIFVGPKLFFRRRWALPAESAPEEFFANANMVPSLQELTHRELFRLAQINAVTSYAEEELVG